MIATGTELLLGAITDRNGPWLCERLSELGVEVAQTVCVGDRPDDLEAALGAMRERGVDLVVTSGGLGPTADDLTAEVVARFAGLEVQLDEALEERIAEILRGFARRMKFDAEGLRAANRKQAMVPVGAEILEPAGTAPGLVVRAGEVVVVVLPGPPRELQTMWPQALETEAVREVLGGAETLRTSTMRMFGLPESSLAKALGEIGADQPLDELEITTCLRRSELVIDVRHAPDQDDLVQGLWSGLEERLGRFVFSRDGRSIDELLFELLEGRTLAVAESCTAGLLAARLTDEPGSSAHFAGGVVAYSNEAKAELLGVDPGLIEARGAVSPEVAEAMAGGALERFGADVAVGVTGVAGPGGGTEEKPVGYVCFCARAADGRALGRDPTLPGTRRDIRERSVVVALHVLRYLLLEQNPPV